MFPDICKSMPIGRILPILLTCCCILAATTDGAAANTTAWERDAVTLRMVQLAQAGRVAEARDALQEYIDAHPADGTMLYNLACLDILLGDHDQALVDLESALDNGYSNFRLMDMDRSLAPIREDPRYLELVERHESALRETSLARALVLEDGYPLADVDLHPAADDDGRVRATATLTNDADALTVEVTVVDPAAGVDRLPWDGGSGLLINLVRPISLDDYESRQYHALGVGCENGVPQAWLVGRDGELGLQPLPEVVPTVERTDDGIRYAVTLPWSVFHPYGPPLDLEMGLNVFYLGAEIDGSQPILSLMPEGRLSYEQSPWRRYVPASFMTSDRSRPVLKGRLYNRLIEGGTVDMEYVIWSAGQADKTCRIEILDMDGNPAAGSEPLVLDLWCEEDLNYFDASVDITGLPTGEYRLVATVDDVGGREAVVVESFTRFADNLFGDLNARIYAMDTPEGGILKYRLFLLVQELDKRHPQQDSSDLLATCAEVTAMIEACEGGGSCLPDAGFFLGGFPVDTMTQRMCALHLPSGHRGLDEPRLMVVVPHEPGMESILAGRIGNNMDPAGDTVVLVPQSHGSTGLAVDKASEHTAMAVEWGRELFRTGDVVLVGLGAGTDAAMITSIRRPELFRQVVIGVDDLLLDDANFSAEGFRDALASHVSDLPYVLLTADADAERTRIIADTMSGLGFHVVVIEVVTEQDVLDVLATGLD